MASPARASNKSAASPAPIQPLSKGSAAAPKLDIDMELGSINSESAGAAAAVAASSSAASIPEQDIMHFARTGDVSSMEKLFESGEFDATFADEEGITPLHWAAINNQYMMCKFLIDHGAEINRKGGESIATPLQWAAQRCHYYTVNLLLQHGADPLITDSQGYNTLHISTFNGNVLLIILLLHQGIPVDVLDSYGHTSLMWAAYKGFPQCVDAFLRWGASVHATDEQGFTALHWALVKGHPACILKMVEYGADRFAKTETGKTPAMTASELHTEAAWHRALKECGFDGDGNLVTPPWPGVAYFLQDKRAFVTRFLFLWPFLLVWTALIALSHLAVYFGIPSAVLLGYGLTFCAKQVLSYAPSDMRQFHKTPWLAGIFAGTLFFVALNWISTVLPHTLVRGESSHFLLNVLFGTCILVTTFFYAACMRYDPGYVPKMNGIAEQQAVIGELLKTWKYDETHFCVACMIRTPLRSKHCRRCQRCVAKHDHHCPWVYNCVGVNTHRHFFFYLISLTLGILLYDWLLWNYFAAISGMASDQCNLVSPGLCKLINADAYTLMLGIWITLQLTWVSMLVATQLIQVSRAMTTYENMTGINTSNSSSSSHSSSSTAFTSTGAPLDPNHPAISTAVPAAATSRRQRGGGGGGGGILRQWSRLLGVDPFIETVAGRGAATGGGRNRRRKKNPYSRGCLLNCKDFWFDPAPVFGQRDNGMALLGGEGVDYTVMYESPTLMQLTGMRGRGRGGYEAVAGEDEV